MVQERGGPLRITIENIQGPRSYPPGGFNTGAAIGSNIGVVAMGTSNLGQLRVINDAMGAGIALISGAGPVPAGLTSGVLVSGLFYVVQSAGISGNQVGIRCFGPTFLGSNGANLSGSNEQIGEVQSGANLAAYTFKVLVQGY